MTFEQGAIAVIATLGGVVSTLFLLMLQAQRAQLKSQANEIKVLRDDVEECKGDRESLWQMLRNMPNPKFCTVPACPLRGTFGQLPAPAPVQMTFSVTPPAIEPNQPEKTQP